MEEVMTREKLLSLMTEKNVARVTDGNKSLDL